MRRLCSALLAQFLAATCVQAAQESPGKPVPVSEVPVVIQGILSKVLEDFLRFMPFMVAAVLVVLITGVAAAVASKIGRRTLQNSRLRASLQALTIRFVRFGVWIAGLLVAAVIVFPDLTPTNVLGGLGVASVAFGLIFKEFFENFFAGILILWRFPMNTGDYIECKNIQGRVEEISMRMTLVRQVSDELVLVPNKFLTANPLTILTNLGKRRVLEVVGVSYASSVDEAAWVIRRALEGCATVDGNHRVEVLLKCLCPSSVDFEVAWWTDPGPYDVRKSRSEVLTAVKRALDEAGIVIPSPQRTVVFGGPLDVKASIGPGRDASAAGGPAGESGPERRGK